LVGTKTSIMTEKIGLIKNPLTIIAIFAGIAEVSGTIVLPFVKEVNQLVFICFLIGFPTLLVCLFFHTLINNNKVLYAPSDYKDEGNYILVNKYNAATQSEFVVKESVNEAFESLSNRFNDLSSRLESMSKAVAIEARSNNQSGDADSGPMQLPPEVINSFGYLVTGDMINKDGFIRKMETLGYHFQSYDEAVSSFPDSKTQSQAIWIGKNVPLEIAQQIVTEAKLFYPFLKYVALNDFVNQSETQNEMFIGGSTAAAKGRLRLLPVSDSEFEKLGQISDLREFHEYIKSFKRKL
jgi:hypothetical protein